MDHKDRVRKAMDRYYQRQQAKQEKELGPKRKNKKPEKDLVEKPCVKWMKSKKWSYQIIEAKAVWSKQRQRFVNSHVKAGTVDCTAVDAYGHSCWIEFKAPGKLSTLNRNEKQKKFLLDKINQNAFACVVDSQQRLEEIYDQWIELRTTGRFNEAREFLLSKMP